MGQGRRATVLHRARQRGVTSPPAGSLSDPATFLNPAGDHPPRDWSPYHIKEICHEKTEDSVVTAVDDRFTGLTPSDLNDVEKQSAVTLAMKVLAIKHRAGRLLSNPEETRNYLRLRLADYQNEVFGAVFLNNRHRIIAVRELFQGTIDGASIHPRVVVQQALSMNAAALVLFHNHPSGVAEPSHADEAITQRLKNALALVDVRVLDHFVVSAGESVSFAERGLL